MWPKSEQRSHSPKFGMVKNKKDSITSANADFRSEKVAELRSKLGDELLQKTPLHNDENSLLRWLIAWNWNIGESFDLTVLCLSLSDPNF